MKKKKIYNLLILFSLTIILTSFIPSNNTSTFNIRANQLQSNQSVSSFQTERGDDALCSIRNTAFKDGEVLTYKMYYNWNFVWIAAGEVTFKVFDQGDQFYIHAKGRTYGSYDPFFKVRDEFQVWIDKKTMLPVTSVRKVQEGGYRLYDMMKYDHEKMEIRSYRGKTKDKTQKFVFPIEDCTHDVLSIIYYIRNKNYTTMKKGTRIPVRILLDKEKYNLSAKYSGKETKSIKDLGKYKTIKLMPQVVSGKVFTDTEGMAIWATDDKNHIPLQIESPLSVGSLKAVLKSHKNTRYPIKKAK